MLKKVKTLLSSEEVKQLTPVSEKLRAIKEDRDRQTEAILTGADKRKMLIIGPCSADNEDAVCDYVARLAKVADKVKDKFLIIPRIYTNKPRTKGEGYKGILHNPDPHNAATDIQAGVIALRKMPILAISESGLSSADGTLYSDNHGFLDDLLT